MSATGKDDLWHHAEQRQHYPRRRRQRQRQPHHHRDRRERRHLHRFDQLENGQATHTGIGDGAQRRQWHGPGNLWHRRRSTAAATSPPRRERRYHRSTNLNERRNGTQARRRQSSEYSRDAGWQRRWQHQSTATNKNGATYNGSTTETDGEVTHTGTCTNAAGAVDCPQRKDDDKN